MKSICYAVLAGLSIFTTNFAGASSTPEEIALVKAALNQASLVVTSPKGQGAATVSIKGAGNVVIIHTHKLFVEGVAVDKIRIAKKGNPHASVIPNFVLTDESEFAGIIAVDPKAFLGGPENAELANYVHSSPRKPVIIEYDSKTGGPVDTGIMVKKNETVYLIAVGKVRIGLFAGDSNAAGLQKKGLEKYAKYPSTPTGALMAFVGGTGMGAIEVPADKVPMRDVAMISLQDKEGQLTLDINDTITNDNKGKFGIILMKE